MGHRLLAPYLRGTDWDVGAHIGFGMLNPHPEEELDDESRAEAMLMHDVAFTPIAMPTLSGPGSIAVTIGMATEVEQPIEYAAIIAGIAMVALTLWLVMRSSLPVLA